MGRLDGREVGGFAAEVEEAVDHPRPAAGRQVHRQALAAEGGLQFLQQPGQVEVFGVDLVHHHDAAQLARLRPERHAPGGDLDAVLGVDDEGRRLDRVEGGDGLAGTCL
jgi:hypothetical protein